MPSHAYSEIYLHITWHTKENALLISSEVERELYPYLRSRAAEDGLRVLAIGGIEDHIHLAVQVPPTVLISDWIGQMKGASSHHINQHFERKVLYWQEGYGIVSFSKRAIVDVVRYVENQREHHSRGRIYFSLEKLS
jgi:putative transposase